ncbi:MAG: C40 family peptidase [Azoarcus sp.]|jgi:proteasome lid subunit RPN8/RPN11|nr:C40 family peptidase [Azoarcus sp.]
MTGASRRAAGVDLDGIVADVLEHAAQTQPRECCGLAVVQRGRLHYVACRNLAARADEFEIAPSDWAVAEDGGEIVAVCHAHIYASPEPSMADQAMCEQSALPWLIVSWPGGTCKVIEPKGWRAPLVGRAFRHGVLDCYALVRDYYRETLGIDLPDFSREDDWWLRGGDLYRENFEAAGFVQIGDGQCRDIRVHDGLLMQVASPVPNHSGVIVEGGQLLQHCHGRLSSRDIFGGYWRKVTTHVLRHRSLL